MNFLFGMAFGVCVTFILANMYLDRVERFFTDMFNRQDDTISALLDELRKARDEDPADWWKEE